MTALIKSKCTTGNSYQYSAGLSYKYITYALFALTSYERHDRLTRFFFHLKFTEKDVDAGVGVSETLVYRRLIREMCVSNGQSLEVSYLHLSKREPMLAIWVADAPADMLTLFNEGTCCFSQIQAHCFKPLFDYLLFTTYITSALFVYTSYEHYRKLTLCFTHRKSRKWKP